MCDNINEVFEEIQNQINGKINELKLVEEPNKFILIIPLSIKKIKEIIFEIDAINDISYQIDDLSSYIKNLIKEIKYLKEKNKILEEKLKIFEEENKIIENQNNEINSHKTKINLMKKEVDEIKGKYNDILKKEESKIITKETLKNNLITILLKFYLIIKHI